MAFTLGKLRAVVVTGAVLVVAVVAGFVWYGKRLAAGFHFHLPKRLGVHIKQQMHVFTYSQSSKGKTVFTVHADDYAQSDNGIITLYNAGIVLYSRQDGQADKIRGKEFHFDPKAGVMQAVGEVFLDLAEPAGQTPSAAKTAADPESRIVHVRTSGLIFNQSAQTAATDARMDWTAQGMVGDAVGADYNAKTGEVVLRSAVHVTGARNGRPVVLTAAHADMRRDAQVLLLEQARYVSVLASAGISESTSVAGDHAVVHLGKDGAPRDIQSQGHVVIVRTGRTAGSGTMTGDNLDVALNAAGQPSAGHLWGGVHYAGADETGPAARQSTGQAQDLRVAFDAAGNPVHALMTGAVQAQEKAAGAGRALTADRLELALHEIVKGKVMLQAADASGGAVLRLAEQGATGRTSTEIRGDDLKAQFLPDPMKPGATRVSDLNGQGHTQVERTGADGSVETSRGDTLESSFKPGTGSGVDAIQRATQRGGVTIVRTLPAVAAKTPGAKPTPATMQHGSAELAVYDGDADRVTLTAGPGGSVQLYDPTDLLLAEHVVLDHGSGDASADGRVRLTYLAADGKGEPLHVLSSRAVEHKDQGTADFFGSAGQPARMWQGPSQVEAPELSFDRGKRTLFAHGEGAPEADLVRTVLVSDAPPKPEVKPNQKQGSGGAVIVLSHQMTYTDGSRQAVFEGRVKAEDRDGVMQAKTATAYLAAPAASSAAAPALAGFPAGRLERVVAAGDVQVTQPGRRAEGDRLVYTAVDATFLMTGTKAEPPKMIDDTQGTVVGTSLRFRSGDNSVMVTGENGDQRVRSDTKVKK